MRVPLVLFFFFCSIHLFSQDTIQSIRVRKKSFSQCGIPDSSKSCSNGNGSIIGQLRYIQDDSTGFFSNACFILKKDGKLVYLDITNEEGVFQIRNICPGTYEVVVSGNGFEESLKGFVVKGKRVTFIDVVYHNGKFTLRTRKRDNH